jgi:hypothetical protein
MDRSSNKYIYALKASINGMECFASCIMFLWLIIQKNIICDTLRKL